MFEEKQNQKAREVKMIRKILTVVLSGFLIATVAYATPQAQTTSNADRKLDKIALKIDKDAQKFGDQAAFEALSERFNIPIATLQSQKQSSNLGFGQLFIANALAKASGKTFDQVVTEFKGGTGFGAMARESNLKLGRIIKEAKRADKEIKEEAKEQLALQKHPERAAKIESKEQREADKRAAAELRSQKSAAKPRGPKH